MGWVVIFVTLLIILIASLGTVYAVKIGQNHKEIEQNRALIIQGQQSHRAICALANDLTDRIADGQDALARSKAAFKKNPNLLPNVPRSLIEQGWDAQQRSIDGQIRTRMVLKKNVGKCPKVTTGAKKN